MGDGIGGRCGQVRRAGHSSPVPVPVPGPSSRRLRFVGARRRFAASRRSTAAAEGRVGRRGRGGAAVAARSRSVSRASAGLPVAQLGAVLAGDHGEHAVGESSTEAGERLAAQRLGHGCGAGDVQRQLDPGVGGVHRLPARPRRPRVPPVQLVRGHGEARPDGESGPVTGWQRHAPIVADRETRRGRRRQSATSAGGSPDPRSDSGRRRRRKTARIATIENARRGSRIMRS